MPAQDSPSSPPRGQLKKLKQSLRPCSRLKERCGVPGEVPTTSPSYLPTKDFSSQVLPGDAGWGWLDPALPEP